MIKTPNKLFYGDNLEVLRKYIPNDSIDLCYIDPPFNSKRNYNQIYTNIGKEDRAQAQAFIDTWIWDTRANEGFAEIISNQRLLFTMQTIEFIIGLEKILHKGSLLAYLVSMTLRIAEIRRVLKPTGSFYLHCDPTASHYLKLLSDSIFCSSGGDFKNEIIWSYKRYTAKSNRFQRLHDIILFYTKSVDSIFNDIRYEYGEKSGIFDSHYKQDENGSWYRMQKRKGKEAYKIMLSPGRRMGDVWEIPHINASANERLGYPTQKPEALLERIITASSNEGQIVLDSYCGCGTTIAVAERLNRKWIGIDITYQSISLVLKRLEDHFGKKTISKISIDGVPRDIESVISLANRQDDRTRKEFEKWSILTFSNNRAVINEKKGSDKGIDGTSFILDKDNKEAPITKKVLFSVKSGNSLPPSIIRDLNGTIEREDAVMGYLISLYPMPNLVKESKKYGNYINKHFGLTYSKITVVSAQEILDGKRMELPFAIDILKKAIQKGDSSQPSLGF